jgi:autophagy-related protein 2
VVEVDGVECQLQVKEKSILLNHDRKRKRTSLRGQAKPRGQSGRKGLNHANDEDVGHTMPTTIDLAESFLQTEPEGERAELEAAILSETQEIGTSSVLSDDGDAEIPMGTGTSLSLPAFMARFLKGIVDRLQVKIQGITLNLDLHVPNETSRVSPNTATDPVTVQVKVDSINIEGVTREIENTPTGEKGTTRNLYKKGKRLICLSKIQGALITEANLFSSLARSSALSSPSATHSDVFDDRKHPSKVRPSRRGSGHTILDGASSPGGTSNSSSSRLSTAYSSRRGENPHPLHNSDVASDNGRFDDAPEEEENRSLSGSLTTDLDSDVGDSVFQNSAYLDQVTESQYFDEGDHTGTGSPSLSFSLDKHRSPTFRSPLSTPRASAYLPSPPEHDEAEQADDNISSTMFQSTVLPTRQHPRFSSGRVSQSQSSLPSKINSAANPVEGTPARSTPPLPDNDSGSSDEYDSSSAPIGEQDLAQSQLFIHEDAESMYMSAVSHDSSARVPGGWDHSSSDSEESCSVLSSPRAPVVQTESLDNLEHARHVSSTRRSAELGSLDNSLSTASILRTDNFPSSPNAAPITAYQVPPISQASSSTSERSTTSSDEYTRMRKQIFIIDQIAIYLPDIEHSGENFGTAKSSDMFGSIFDGNDVSRSASMDLPGTFSTHLPTQRSSQQPNLIQQAAEKKSESKPGSDTSIEIDFGQMFSHFDMSVGRLAWKLVQRLKDALKTDPHVSVQTKIETTSTNTNLKFNAESISLKFLERLEGTLTSSSAVSENTPWVEAPVGDVLLRTTLDGLRVHSHGSQSTKETTIQLRKLMFGYAHESIVSFDAGLQLRSSVRDLKASDGIDVSMSIVQKMNTTHIDMKTLPLHVAVDLQRLDETFSWFGGLSSVLNLGSSIASNATITAPNPSKSKPRNVRFEAPSILDDQPSAARNKTDVRIGGFVLDLIGQDCTVGVETSAVKLVSRDAVAGMGIQKIRLSGPHLRRSNDDPAITMDISGTRIEYLPSPKDADLDTLLSLITPSKAKYDQDDDILLDTLLRQRKQGAVLRLGIDDFQMRIAKLDELSYLPELGDEVARLATVTKYLPDDDRPGLLSLTKVRRFDVQINVGHGTGMVKLALKDIEVAQITLPALVALSVSELSVHRNGKEEILGAATDPELREPRARSPAIMVRMIGDEMEPIIKIKLWNMKLEYRVATLIALLNLAEDFSSQGISASLAASAATLTGVAQSSVSQAQRRDDRTTKSSKALSKPLTIDFILRDCILGLNPMALPSKVLVVLTEAHLSAVLPKDNKASAIGEMSKASVLVIDDVAHITSGSSPTRPRRQSFDGGSSQVADLCATGFVSVSYISSAKAILQMSTGEEGEHTIDVELRDDLFVLESCADSTQTLITVLNGLTPPAPPSKEIKYRTKVIPVADLLASLSGDAFGTAEGDYNFDDDFGAPEMGDMAGGEDEDDFDFDSNYYQTSDDKYNAEILEDDGCVTSAQLTIRDTNDGVLLESFVEPQESVRGNDELEFQEDHFGTGSLLEGTAHRWNSAKNTYDRSNANKVRKSPLKVCIRDVHIIWNLFDGYDWQHTRDTITKAVQEVESKAIERRARNERRPTFEQDIEDEETVIGDFLFNSIYIGIPGNRDPRELAAAINQELNDNATETESIATTSLSSSPSRQGGPRRVESKRLRLNRSKHHKITFELRGVCADLVTFPPGSGETQSSIDIRVRDFEIFDHVPTSTWRKFASYMQDAGERETGTSMIHIELLNVKPIPELAASEIVLKATVLPLRLHVDQDALDFITRFFEFKDNSAPVHATPGDLPFLQRVEVNSVQVKLDFKPKRVDYAGLRSGHTTEFMNFLILDEADMVLRHTIIYGISGFDKLGKTLNDIWMPEIKRNQLPGILAGLAPVRSIVNVGGGFRHLVVVPMREYKKDGRIVRSISKGAAAFARTTGTELVKLGAKVAIGVQTVLQGAEGFLGQPVETTKTGLDEEDEDEESKQISLYANQPVGVLQGLRGGYAGLQRDLILARDAIIAVPGEAMEGGNAAGVLRAVRKHAPTVILRPAIGVAKAGGQILMGATNSLDPVNLQKADAVSHHQPPCLFL